MSTLQNILCICMLSQFWKKFHFIQIQHAEHNNDTSITEFNIVFVIKFYNNTNIFWWSHESHLFHTNKPVSWYHSKIMHTRTISNNRVATKLNHLTRHFYCFDAYLDTCVFNTWNIKIIQHNIIFCAIILDLQQYFIIAKT